MGVPPNEFLNLLQGINQPLPERNFTPGPGMGPMAMPQAPAVQPAPLAPQAPMIAPVMPPVQQPVSPFSFGGMEDALLRSAGLQAQSARGIMQAQQQAARQEQEAIKAQQQALSAFQAEQQKAQQDYDVKVKPELDKLTRLSEQIASTPVESYWARRSTPQKIGAAIAVGLGALGASLARGPNYALDIINKAVDDDLKIQQANIDNKNRAFLNQRQYINDLQSSFKDKEQFRLANKALALDQVNTQLMQIAAKRKEVEALPQFQALQANILDQRNKQFLELARLKAETAKLEREAVQGPEAKPENIVPGLGFAFSTKGADEMRTLVSDLNAAKDSIARLVEISQTPGKAISPELRAEADTIRSTLRGQLRTALVGPGAVTESEQKLLNQVIADPTTIFSLDRVNLTRLNALNEALDRKVQSAAAANIIGYQKPERQVAQPAARITPALQAQAQAQLQAANQRLVQNPNDEQAKQVRDRALLILGQ